MTLTEIYEQLRHRERAPRAFDGNDAPIPWHDPAFSEAFYDLHTRNHGDTEAETEAMLRWLKLKPGARVLDLGCGGGRTLKALGEQGMRGAGIDIGPYPVKVAREAVAGMPIEILEGDMREIAPQGPFDAALCLFGQITTFPEDEAERVLKVAAASLAPRGQLLLELYLGPALLDAIEDMESWTITDRWMGGEYPQLVLDEHYVSYAEQEYVRTSWVIAMGQGGPPIACYRQGSLLYDEARLTHLLRRAGFHLTALYGDFDGQPFGEDSVNMIAVGQLYE